MSEEQNKKSVDSPSVGNQSAGSPPGAASAKSDQSQPQTINLSAEQAGDKPETSTMEVHKHPHDVTHKKKWGEYFLEFLMIFLAVFLGFVAENFREHIAERKTEKKYVRSFVEDLQKDSATLIGVSSMVNRRIANLDSAIFFLESPDLKKDGANRYYYARQATRTDNFSFSDRTILQLMNAGGFRLINNKDVVDSILNYQALVNSFKFSMTTEDAESKLMYPYIAKLFDGKVLDEMVDSADQIGKPAGDPLLTSGDRNSISELIYFIHQRKTTLYSEKRKVRRLQQAAANISEYLKNKYVLE